MTEITLKLDDPAGAARRLRDLIAVNSDDVDPTERPFVEGIAAQIEEQAKPTIEEPTEFGSIIRASTDKFEDQLWTSAPRTGDHYWHSETGKLEVWSELRDPEVLRVGIGETDERAEGEAFKAGVRNTVARGIAVLEGFRGNAVTAERKDAYQNAINVLRELL